MFFDALYHKITELTEQVESLLAEEQEEKCASLLIERQSLLEKLKHHVDNIESHEQLAIEQKRLHDFLLTLQTRDNLSVQAVKEKAQQLLNQGSQQAKGNKAIKAYRSVL